MVLLPTLCLVLAPLHLVLGGTHLDTRWFRWQGGTVNFYFQDMENADRRVIRTAMKMVEKNTCLQFNEEKGPLTGHHLKVQGASTSCLSGPGKVPTFSATVGPTPPDMTQVVLQSYYRLADSPRCVNESSGGLLHELFHVFGVMHTQKRADRDRHVTVLKENIQDQFEYSYDICYECRDYGVPYDCDSIMHFGTETFSLGLPTMEARVGSCDLRWVGAAFDGRHGAEVASPSDWLLLSKIADRLCSPSSSSSSASSSSERPRRLEASKTITTPSDSVTSPSSRISRTTERPSRRSRTTSRSSRKPRKEEKQLPAPWKRRPKPAKE